MNRTKELLWRTAGGVEPRKSTHKKEDGRTSTSNSDNAKNNNKSNPHDSGGRSSRTKSLNDSTSPPASPQHSGTPANNSGPAHDRSSGSPSSTAEDDKKWKQKITTTIMKRLMQPTRLETERVVGTRISTNASTEPSIPRLGEVPARSKYYREAQQNSHFATTSDYIPLADELGVPPPSTAYQTSTPIVGPPESPSQHPSQGQKGGSPKAHHRTSRDSNEKKRNSSSDGHHHRHSSGNGNQHRRRSSGGSHLKRREHRRDRHDNEGSAVYEGLEDYDFAEGADEREGSSVLLESDYDDEYSANEDSAMELNYEGETQEGYTDHMDDEHEPAVEDGDHNRGNAAAAYSELREDMVSGIPGNYPRQTYDGSGSGTSATSSIGPTGLPLRPQFRWVPRMDGGGHGFNPFMAFRRPGHQQQQQQQQQFYGAPPGSLPYPTSPAGNVMTTPKNAEAQHAQEVKPPVAVSTVALHKSEDNNAVAERRENSESPRHGSYNFFYNSPSPPLQQQMPFRSPDLNSFYGPIGSLGLEASRKRRQMDRARGVEGGAEKEYKERTSRKANRFDDDKILEITKVWCDTTLLSKALHVDSPVLPADDDDDDDDTGSSTMSSTDLFEWEGDSDNATTPAAVAGKNNNNNDGNSAATAGKAQSPKYDAATMAAREARVRKQRIRRERRHYNRPPQSPSFYFAGGEFSGLPVALNDGKQVLQPANASPAARSKDGGEKGPTSRTGATRAGAEKDGSASAVAAAMGNRSRDRSNRDGNSSSSSSNDSSDDSDTDSRSDVSSNSRSDSDSDDGNDTSRVVTPDQDEQKPRAVANTHSSHSGAATARQHPMQQRVMTGTVIENSMMGGGPGATVRRGSTAEDTGRYDFMNSSMMGGEGGVSLMFPQDDPEMSIGVGASVMMLPGTPQLWTSYPSVERGGGQHRETSPLSGRTPVSHVVPAAPTPSYDKGGSAVPATQARPVSGTGAAAANALRNRKTTSIATDTRATSAAQQQQRRNPASTSEYESTMGGHFAYGSSFDLNGEHGEPPQHRSPSQPSHGAPSVYSATPAYSVGHTPNISPQSNNAGGNRPGGEGREETTNHNTNSNARDNSTSPGAYMMDARDYSESPALYGDNRNISNSPGAHPSREETEPLAHYAVGYRGTNAVTPGHGGHSPSHPNTSTNPNSNGRSSAAATANSNTNTNSGARGVSSETPVGYSLVDGAVSTRAAGHTPGILGARPTAGTVPMPNGGYQTRAAGHTPGIPQLPNSNNNSRGPAAPRTPFTDNRRASQPITSQARMNLMGMGGAAPMNAYYAPVSPPGTPGDRTPVHGRRSSAATAADARASVNMSATPGLGESTNLGDHMYELPGL